MLTYKIHLIRHGITQGNLDGQYIGRTDLPLCPQGICEIENLLDEYEYPKVGMVYVSPLKRCIQTADILYPHSPVTVIPNLTEMNMGEFDGKSLSELNEDSRFTAWLENTLENPPPGGEDPVEFVGRIISALEQIFHHMMETKTHEAAVITHGGVIMSLLASLGMPRLPIQEWKCGSGFGYTIFLTPETWTRDRVFEIFEQIPQTLEQRNAQWMLERFGSLNGENDDWEDDEDDTDEKW